MCAAKPGECNKNNILLSVRPGENPTTVLAEIEDIREGKTSDLTWQNSGENTEFCQVRSEVLPSLISSSSAKTVVGFTPGLTLNKILFLLHSPGLAAQITPKPFNLPVVK
ncbi:COP23 domain-containing protein [Anabaena sp. AL93]|uniref:COP23 domain-containing protein n=1 Tax=Anabaena sp. AL93 TaxID=1678133 RepID=UPI00345B6247